MAIRIILPHGDYRDLLAYQKSDIVYQGTVCFCRRFLQAGDRTVDQMVQAARSCKQNIVEGSEASGTSKETELKLTNVARASLEELLEDYLDYLRTHGLALWPKEGEKAAAARKLGLKKAYADYQDYFETRPAETVCNLQICFIYQAAYLIDQLIRQLEANFEAHGGIRERMHDARMAARGNEWEKALFSRLETSASPEELKKRAAEIRAAAERLSAEIAARHHWL